MSAANQSEIRFALCIRNDDYQAALEVRKIYRVIADAEADQNDRVRVIDESGEDYLYPARYFVPITLPEAAADVFRAAS